MNEKAKLIKSLRRFDMVFAKQAPRARYEGRRGKTSRGRHLFASDEELVAGLDV